MLRFFFSASFLPARWNLWQARPSFGPSSSHQAFISARLQWKCGWPGFSEPMQQPKSIQTCRFSWVILLLFYLVFLFASSVLNFHCGSTRCWRVFMFGHLQMRPPAIEKMIHTHSPFSPKTKKKSKDLGHKLFFTFMRWSFNIFFRDALYNWPGIMRENPRCH